MCVIGATLFVDELDFVGGPLTLYENDEIRDLSPVVTLNENNSRHEREMWVKPVKHDIWDVL